MGFIPSPPIPRLCWFKPFVFDFLKPGEDLKTYEDEKPNEKLTLIEQKEKENERDNNAS